MFGLNWSLFNVNYCCQWVCSCFGSNSEDRGRLFCFGAGPRGCVGQRLVWNILKVGHTRRKVRNIRDNKVVNWVDGQRKNLLYFPDWFIYTFQTVVGELLKNYSLTVIQGQDLTQKWLPVSRPKAEVKVKFRKKTGS